MKVLMTIRFHSPAGPVMQSGYFELRGKKPEDLACEWWKQIQKEVYAEGLSEVIVDGEDIIGKVRALLGDE